MSSSFQALVQLGSTPLAMSPNIVISNWIRKGTTILKSPSSPEHDRVLLLFAINSPVEAIGGKPEYSGGGGLSTFPGTFVYHVVLMDTLADPWHKSESPCVDYHSILLGAGSNSKTVRYHSLRHGRS
jgi:hypothetical protein